jgi:hypothetical protein
MENWIRPLNGRPTRNATRPIDDAQRLAKRSRRSLPWVPESFVLNRLSYAE